MAVCVRTVKTFQSGSKWSNRAAAFAILLLVVKPQHPLVVDSCCDEINYFCGNAMETAAYRSHFTFQRWTGLGCKGQLSETFILCNQAVACLNMTDCSRLHQDLYQRTEEKELIRFYLYFCRVFASSQLCHFKLRSQTCRVDSDQIVLTCQRMLEIVTRAKY